MKHSGPLKIVLLLLIMALVLVVPTQSTHAQGALAIGAFVLSKIAPTAMADLATEGLVALGSMFMVVASFILTATGALMNASLTLTLHISAFVNSITGIYEVWRAIRDLSALFLIFFLLWAAFQMILKTESPKLGALLKNLVIAGVLINFSFFFASVLIDASNLISLQIYKQMVPERVYNRVIVAPKAGDTAPSGQSLTNSVIRQAYQEGGISDIFLSAFSITALQGNIGQFKGSSNAEIKMRMFIMQVMGIAAMLMASFLFLFASLAFLFRLGLLIFILAFSPIYFAAFIIPQVKERSDKGWKLFKTQLIFMPVFLLLLYMSLKVIATGNFTGTDVIISDDQNFFLSMIGLFGNFFFVIVLLMIPFIGAMSLGGMATSLAGKWTHGVKNWARGAITRGGAAAWTNTGGRAASAIARSEGLKDWAGSSIFGGAALKGIRKVSGKYDKKLGDQVKARTDFAESLGHNADRVNRDETDLRNLKREQSRLRSIGDTTGAKALDTNIKNTESRIESIKNERKLAYAERINTPSAETLLLKIARKNKVAAAKIQTEILKKQLEKENKSLEKLREEIKNTNTKLENVRNKITNQGGPANAGQAAQILQLQSKISNLQNDEPAMIDRVNDLEARLALTQ